MKTVIKTLKSLIKAALICAVAFSAPHVGNAYLRHEVGSEVVKITKVSGKGGGTGFHVKAPSGRTYILTNKHVCEGTMSESGTVKVQAQESESPITRRVIAIYKDHDLCLVEPIHGHSGIDVADDASIGEEVYVFGHPGLRPLTRSQGEIIDREEIVIANRPKADGSCSEGQESYFGIFCLGAYDSYQVSFSIYPGNSGSPMVNKFGNVAGVIFAGTNDLEHGGFVVPLEYIQDFLSKY